MELKATNKCTEDKAKLGEHDMEYSYELDGVTFLQPFKFLIKVNCNSPYKPPLPLGTILNLTTTGFTEFILVFDKEDSDFDKVCATG